MKVATPNTVRLHRAAAKTPGSEYAFWERSRAVTQDCRTTPAPHFTPRQLEVLALLCEGLPNKLICRRLDIATGTVKVHISCILRKLAAKSRLEAVVKARGLGLPGEPVAGMPEPGIAARAAGQAVEGVRPREGAASGRIAVAA